MAQPLRPPQCYCGKLCMMQSCWDGGEAGRCYWHCMNQFYKVPGEPICEFEEWVDEPCYQEYYKEKLQFLHNMCLRQQETQSESDRTIAEMRAKLKEVEEEKLKAQWNCEAQNELCFLGVLLMMAGVGEKEVEEYESDPEEAKMSLKMRRREASSDDEEESEKTEMPSRRIDDSDDDSEEGQGAAAEYD
ncbi:PREDICTED: clusterin-associated protein 1-like [Nicotiana attenuata]|uniref:clusterin-associated protein 1-like n=1 Tax=Nicotiana attenuata TaxID=49451 RepID=UPI000904FACD|nr:PREDICTED: clusterin-associated protein 1-like [Nicotiana attenuata]